MRSPGGFPNVCSTAGYWSTVERFSTITSNSKYTHEYLPEITIKLYPHVL